MTPELFPGSEKYPLLSRESVLVHLSDYYGGHGVWMYSDDPSDFAFGGNKVRFYEYLIPEIIKASPDFILTSGSIYSNHIRVSAEVCSKLGIGCTLLIEDDPPSDGIPSPNVRIAEKLGAEIVYIGSFAAMIKIREYADNLRAEGKKFFHVPNAGHTPGAVRAYAGVLADALMKADGLGVSFSHIFLPCASGTTQAGMICGSNILRAYGVNVPGISSIAVGNSVKGASKSIKKLIAEAGQILPGIPDHADDPVVCDCGKNEYGRPDAELLELRQQIIRNDCIELDRTYNINAFYGMKQILESAPADDEVLYINTGGYTGE